MVSLLAEERVECGLRDWVAGEVAQKTTYIMRKVTKLLSSQINKFPVEIYLKCLTVFISGCTRMILLYKVIQIWP